MPIFALASLLLAAQGQPVQGPLVTEQPDPYVWLEDVSGKRSLDWVRAENARTANVLEKDPRFPKLQAEALKIAESPDRLPAPEFRNGMVYNFWQDRDHPQGILRRTTLADYRKAKPNWENVLDVDALGKRDREKWVSHGLIGLYPNDRKVLVNLSAGGEDAVNLREFDLKKAAFVKGGFALPRSKQNVDWLDADTLLVARDWGKGTMTASGYPFVVKLVRRGQPLAKAQEIFRGTPQDVSTGPSVLHDAQGNRLILLQRGLDFFHNATYVWEGGQARRLAIPERSEVDGLLDGRLIVTLKEGWKGFKQGSVVSLDAGAIRRDPAHPKPTLVFAPTAKEFPQQVALTRNRLILTTLENVQGRAYVCHPVAKGAWTRTKLAVGDNLSVFVLTTDEASDRFVLGETGFLTPASVLMGDAAQNTLVALKTQRSQFDASKLKVEQIFATSTDGTRVPYFVVHRKDLAYDGAAPTLMTAYGGFESSEKPYYSGNVGKLWLERGGAYVLANIRGGGEFGPAWHEAGLKTHRQRIYDDFASVARDLFARKITSPRRLGIEGGSNGGLLMGVEMTQHPELWNAVIIEVPLLDMIRFEKIAAGASWVGEYGSVSNPEERRFLASISPYNQLRAEATYPEPLIWTTTKDDRVGPVHARKFAARMKEFGKPYLYREIVEGGHGAGANLKEAATTNALNFVYLMRKLMNS